MAENYIYPAPGVTNVELTLTLEAISDAVADEITGIDSDNIPMVVAGLQDITMEASNDEFEWTQLDLQGKRKIATTSTNSLSGTLVVNKDQFFGTGGTPTQGEPEDGVLTAGIFGLSTGKYKVKAEVYTGDEDDGTAGKYISAECFITGLSPTVSADQPVWTTTFTLAVDGDWTVSDTATIT